MKYYHLLLLSLTALACTLFAGCTDDEEKPGKEDWVLVWADEFDESTPDNKPDPSKWIYETGAGGNGNNELQIYTDRAENASLTSYKGLGCLKITALNDNYRGVAYSSARIKTEGLFQQAYGRFEARMQLPYGPGIWPAFWLLGADYNTVGWPRCGEIDIMENKGWQPGVVSSALHFPGHSGGNPITQTFGYEHSRFDTDFHLYAVEWDETKIDFYVDNTLYKRVKTSDADGGEWVFDHPFFIILNLAVGGDFVGNPTEDTVFPQNLYIDYVRVYRKSSAPAQNTRPGGKVNPNGNIDGWEDKDSDKGTITPEL